MTCKLSVLGGGSPFTIALIDSLAGVVDALPIVHLSLHGRSADGLARIADYARSRLTPFGWTVTHSTRLEESLEGSAFVVQQIRFGGLDGRAADEEIARKCGLAADETLGAAATHCVLRTAASLRTLGRAIARATPDAWVLNLTNPLGIATALLKREGVARCLGVCELPITTARGVADLLACDISELTWDYVGLNHRGFIVNIRRHGQEVCSQIVDRLGSRRLAGISGSTIKSLNAVPTKYFQLVLQPSRPDSASRAGVLSSLRRRIMEELHASPGRRPPSLASREMDWYDASLVPLLRALCDPSGATLIVNEMSGLGIVEERVAHVSTRGVVGRPPPPVTADLNRWLEIFRAHESALLAAAIESTPSRIRDAIIADPTIPIPAREEVIFQLCAALPASA